MISEEKMTHIIHLILDGIESGGHVKFTEKEKALHEAKKIGFKFVSSIAKAEETARQRISSQKNPPPEQSSQWEILYRKYYEEEMSKIGA